MQGIECKINLIMFNPHKGTRFTASSMEQVEAFKDTILAVSLLCNVLCNLMLFPFVVIVIAVFEAETIIVEKPHLQKSSPNLFCALFAV